MPWILWIAIVFLIVELIFIYIVVHKSYRMKQTIDPIDDHIRDMNRAYLDKEDSSNPR